MSPDPIGLGTQEAESAISYFCRLAKLNDVKPTQILQGSPLIPLTTSQPDLLRLQAWGPNFFLERHVSTSETGADFLSTLADIIGRQEIKRTSWRLIFPDFSFHTFNKSFNSWCPDCLGTDTVPYGRMLWEVSQVTECPIHSRPLESECNSCGFRDPLVGRLDPLKCRRCKADLRVVGRVSEGRDHFSIVSREIAALVAIVTSTKQPFSCQREACMQCLLRLAGQTDGRVTSAASRSLQIGFSELSGWVTGRHRPRLSRLIDVAVTNGIPPLALLDGSARGPIQHTKFGRRTSALSSRIPAPEIERFEANLQKWRTEFPDWGIKTMARKLKVSPETLARCLPELVSQIIKDRSVAMERSRKRRWKWFSQRVDRYVRVAKESGTMPTVIGTLSVFKGHGFMYNPKYSSYLFDAVRRTKRAMAGTTSQAKR